MEAKNNVSGNWGGIFTSLLKGKGISHSKASKDLKIPLRVLEGYLNETTPMDERMLIKLSTYLNVKL